MQAGEEALSLRELAEGRVPVALAALLIEQAAAVSLTQSELATAQADVLRAANLVAAFPHLLGGLAGSVHMLVGAPRVTSGLQLSVLRASQVCTLM